MKNNMHARLVVKEGKLDFPNKAQETRFNSFLKEIPDGSPIDIFIGVSTEKGSNAQLARVHAMIRELAQYIGYTFEEVKLQCKRKAGLCFVRDKQEYCKSFAECDRDELNLVIQALVEMGDFNGMQLR